MPNAIPSKCNWFGCKLFGTWQGGRCPDHAKEHEAQRKTPISQGMFNAAWKRVTGYLVSCGNASCQRVGLDGHRCNRPGAIWHHIILVDERPDLMHHHENLVHVCRSCHPRPSDADQGRYLPTLYRAPMVNDPLPQQVCGPGEKVPYGVELWDLANRRKRFAPEEVH